MSEAAEVTQSAPSAEQTTTEQSSFSIPQEYADRGWTKTVKSSDDLFKAFDNAQSLLGKRPAGIPAPDAPQEEFDKFYKSLGRPETPAAYELKADFEGLPEGVNLEQARTQAQQLAHKIGLSPKQASELWEGYMSMELEALGKGGAESEARQKELDAEFDQLADKLFGDKFEDVSKSAQEYLKAVLPDELKGALEGMDNKTLLSLVHLADHSQKEIAKIKAEYGVEDKLSSGHRPAGVSVNDINIKLNEAKKRYNDAPVFSLERKAATDEINALREQLKRSI